MTWNPLAPTCPSAPEAIPPGLPAVACLRICHSCFDLLADALRCPVFPSEQVERLRTQFLTGLAIRAQDTAEMASLTFDQIVFEGHPYARPDDGWPETIQAITRDDLADFHHIHYGPRGLVLAIVGAVEPKAIAGQVAKVLGDWTNPSQPELPALPELKPLKEHCHPKGQNPRQIPS